MNRRQFLRAAGQSAISAALGLSLSRKASAAVPAGRPNFLFIFTDDQRHDAMGCAGNRLIHTPNVDKLAARGVRFENAFVTLSICSPSRAACLTGRYGSGNGVVTIGPGHKLAAGEKTFAHHLKAAGYRTGFVGKWHLKDRPAECGFDYAMHFESNGPHTNRQVTEEGRKQTAQGFIEDYTAGKAVAFMRAASDADKPFVLWHCTQVPHMTPRFTWNPSPATLARYDPDRMPVPRTWRDDLTGKPPYLKTARSRTKALAYGYDKPDAIRDHVRRYYGAVTEMDASLGRVLDALESLGLADNTYVFFMGDNGWFLGEHGFTSKVLPYEESIRVPLIVAGPGIKPRVADPLVLNVDLAPTMLDMAGLEAPANVHGRSLKGLLEGRKVPWRSSIYYEAPASQLGSRPLLAVRDERWKYVQTFEGQRLDPTAKPTFEELYDLKTDPLETTNLAADPQHAETRKRLVAELAKLGKSLKP